MKITNMRQLNAEISRRSNVPITTVAKVTGKLGDIMWEDVITGRGTTISEVILNNGKKRAKARKRKVKK